MLSDNESSKFLALLLTFTTVLGMSDRSVANLFGLSHKTVSRWMGAARLAAAGEPVPQYRIYHHLASEVSKKVTYLMKVTNPAQLTSIPSRADRLQSLKDALSKRSV